MCSKTTGLLYKLFASLPQGRGLQPVARDGRGTPEVPQRRVLQQKCSAAEQGSGHLLQSLAILQTQSPQISGALFCGSESMFPIVQAAAVMVRC